jgi:serine/threonine protein kinase
MHVSLREKIGEGGFGDIWKAEDAIGRTVAVKFIRPSAAEMSTALDHARALGRLNHPSIVSVYSVESLTDPESGELRDAVVMEFLHGETLATRLRRTRFSQSEVLEIGTKLLDGLEHIHLQGIAHGDLHGDNVILQGSQPKIIDILYRDSLALLSNATKDTRLRKDIVSVRMMLYDILLTSELDPADAAEFNSSLSHQPALFELREAFLIVADACGAATTLCGLNNQFNASRMRHSWNLRHTRVL